MMQPISILIVAADRDRAWDLGEQFDADGHSIHLAHCLLYTSPSPRD